MSIRSSNVAKDNVGSECGVVAVVPWSEELASIWMTERRFRDKLHNRHRNGISECRRCPVGYKEYYLKIANAYINK